MRGAAVKWVPLDDGPKPGNEEDEGRPPLVLLLKRLGPAREPKEADEPPEAEAPDLKANEAVRADAVKRDRVRLNMRRCGGTERPKTKKRESISCPWRKVLPFQEMKRENGKEKIEDTFLKFLYYARYPTGAKEEFETSLKMTREDGNPICLLPSSE